MSRRTFLRRLSGDRRGVTVIEFAMIAPAMMLTLMGLGDLLYQTYAQAMLDGAIQKAGRDSAIQGGAQRIGELDQNVLSQLHGIAQNATFTSTRKSYSSFSAMRPETFTDGDADGICNNGEPFTDINGNDQWDADPGRLNNQGGANDVTLYEIQITYPRLFPMAGLLGWSPQQTINARTLLKNQPFARQDVIEPSTENCS